MTSVMDLRTGNVMTYSVTPVPAVILAFQQSRGNMNWWQRGYWDIPVIVGPRTVSCGGDLCALRRQPRRCDK